MTWQNLFINNGIRLLGLTPLDRYVLHSGVCFARANEMCLKDVNLVHRGYLRDP
jgi:hypothetical protein